ncbi:hypothetical protein RRG08_059635 [Elysia crispata]|uniref:Uncharacterized protein n=1 Tax=Elysia crispata TaxID=231223 RepID=A0AAE1DK04_9GAST|nr:hypothetical protein RRG08_059635 [Elysia crispata]
MWTACAQPSGITVKATDRATESKVMKQELAQVLGTGPSLYVASKIVWVCVCMELYQCCSVASCPSCLLLSSGQKLSRQQCRTKIVCVCVCVWNCTSGVASLAAHLAYCSVARQKLSRQQWRTSVASLVAATIATNLLT